MRELPKRVGSYRLGKKVAEGSVWELYRATHDDMGESRMIKRARDVGDRWFEAASRLARVESRVILPTWDEMHDPSGRLWLIVNRVSGCSLGDWLCRRGGLSITAIASIGGQLADGLMAALAKGVLFLDLNIDDVWITPYPAVVGGALATLVGLGQVSLCAPSAGGTRVQGVSVEEDFAVELTRRLLADTIGVPDTRGSAWEPATEPPVDSRATLQAVLDRAAAGGPGRLGLAAFHCELQALARLLWGLERPTPRTWPDPPPGRG